jgi:signal peptidase I
MNLKDYLNQPIELVGNNSQDSILISVKSPSQETKTIAVESGTRRVYKDPYFEAEGKKIKPKKTAGAVFKALSAISFWSIISLTFVILILRFSSVLSFNIILTGSMEPAIKPGDMIVTINDKYLQPKINDVVIYEGKRFSGEVVAPFAHRIIGGSEKTGWILKGDANPAPDIQKPTSIDILGVVIATIPNAGNILNFKALIFLAVIFISIFLTKEILREGND